MKKNELVKKISKDVAFPTNVVGETLEGFKNVIIKCLEKGENIFYQDFISIELIERKATRRRNPVTGLVDDYPAYITPKVKLGKSLIDAARASQFKDKTEDIDDVEDYKEEYDLEETEEE